MKSAMPARHAGRPSRKVEFERTLNGTAIVLCTLVFKDTEDERGAQIIGQGCRSIC